MRLLSFSLTEPQLLDGSKDVTRRLGWRNLLAGTRLQAVRKSQGIPKGGTVHRLGVVIVVAVRREPLNAITPKDVKREGFPEMSPEEFVEMFTAAMQCEPDTEVTRISFRREHECPCPECGSLMPLELCGSAPKLWLQYRCDVPDCHGKHPADFATGAPTVPVTPEEQRARQEAREALAAFRKSQGLKLWQAWAWVDDRVSGLPRRVSEMSVEQCQQLIKVTKGSL